MRDLSILDQESIELITYYIGYDFDDILAEGILLIGKFNGLLVFPVMHSFLRFSCMLHDDGERNSKILMTTVVVDRPYSRLHTKINQMSVEIINS